MTEIENFALSQIKMLVPDFQKLEFRAIVGDTTHAMEFFVSTHGERLQCYELADNGVFKEEALEKVFDSITSYIRQSGEYKKGEVNKLRFEYEAGDVKR
jgi:hypothetical protein